MKNHSKLALLQPLRYHEMFRLKMWAQLLLTDSGGLQPECCVLGTPCLLQSDTTEWAVTLKESSGSGVLAGNQISNLRKKFQQALTLSPDSTRPPLWNGKTATRIERTLISH